MSGELATSTVRRDGQAVSVATAAGAVRIGGDGSLEIGGLGTRLVPRAAGREPDEVRVSGASDAPLLARVIHDYAFGADVSGRTTWDVHRHGAVHVHVRLRAERAVELAGLELPRMETPAAEVEQVGGTAWAWIEDAERALAV